MGVLGLRWGKARHRFAEPLPKSLAISRTDALKSNR